MTEDEAIAQLTQRLNVPRETISALRHVADLIMTENRNQNLIASGTEASIWERHILDSAQLLLLVRACDGTWLDVGTGAGFPGLVLAVMTQSEHVFVERRAKRAEFLRAAAATLSISSRVRVVQRSVEQLREVPVEIITARAVMSLNAILEATRHLADRSTTWLLHKGRNARFEVDVAAAVWNADFEMLPSITASDAAIVRVRNFTGRVAR